LDIQGVVSGRFGAEAAGRDRFNDDFAHSSSLRQCQAREKVDQRSASAEHERVQAERQQSRFTVQGFAESASSLHSFENTA